MNLLQIVCKASRDEYGELGDEVLGGSMANLDLSVHIAQYVFIYTKNKK